MKNRDTQLLEEAYQQVQAYDKVDAYDKVNIEHIKEPFKFQDQYFIGDFMSSSDSTRLYPQGWKKLFRVLEGPYTEQEVKNKKEFSNAPDLTEYEYADALVNLYLDRKS